VTGLEVRVAAGMIELAYGDEPELARVAEALERP
jgi:hypothetical protein